PAGRPSCWSPAGGAGRERKASRRFQTGPNTTNLPSLIVRMRSQEDHAMSIFRRLRTAIVALTAVLAMGFGSAALADSGTIQLSWIKGGWFIGGSAGSGTL